MQRMWRRGDKDTGVRKSCPFALHLLPPGLAERNWPHLLWVGKSSLNLTPPPMVSGGGMGHRGLPEERPDPHDWGAASAPPLHLTLQPLYRFAHGSPCCSAPNPLPPPLPAFSFSFFPAYAASSRTKLGSWKPSSAGDTGGRTSAPGKVWRTRGPSQPGSETTGERVPGQGSLGASSQGPQP